MKIPVPLAVHPSHEAVEVSGEIVDVAPHLAHVATWIVHRNPPDFPSRWRVSHVESGRSCGYAGAQTKTLAVAQATEMLRGITPRKFLETMRELGIK